MSLEDCLEKELIRKANTFERISGSLKVAEHFLERAEGSFKINYYDTSYLMAYNSLFHSARALLFKKGYTERSHYCLILFLKKEYTGYDEIIKYLNFLNLYRSFRESIQYSGDLCSKEDAIEIKKSAKEFLKMVINIIKD
jgi:uncharacterized protein (UPF0332 family)